jgi:hypothetical protein
MIADFLAHDDKLNHTEFPTEDRAPPSANPNISVEMLSAPPQDTFHFYQDDDSVSTFMQTPTQPTFGLSPSISRIFHPQLLVHTQVLNQLQVALLQGGHPESPQA